MSAAVSQRGARRIVVAGRVQGVGFRPFVYRLATRLGIAGSVRNDSGEVIIHIEGDDGLFDTFVKALRDEAPPLARPEVRSSVAIPVEGASGFVILPSRADAAADVHLPPDLFCCDECLAELSDPTARRYRYPFTNCTQCGPRYTIIRTLPYDRPATSMAGFEMCPACRAEYLDPGDRRFHAQPLACPDCGPVLRFRKHADEPVSGEAALASAVLLLKAGGIVAVKGIGGYHLMCDAANDAALAKLRARKHRPDKPLAVMFPQWGQDRLDAVREAVVLTELESEAVASPERPIVLVRRRDDCTLSAHLAPGLGELGVFLPYSPLHHLLLGDFGGPLVATSGNISGEPVITDPGEADARLADIAEGFLDHDRPIVRPADDSVARVIDGAPRVIRAGRGMAPVEVDLPFELPRPVLAVGGHMKATIALGWGRRAVVSPHIGDLDSSRSLEVFEQVIADLSRLYRVQPQVIVRDCHPGYASTRWAKARGVPAIPVQHHKAHASALAAESPEISYWLVFAWDGVGYGEDGTLWGGETFSGRPGAWRRVGSLRPLSVTGGDRVGREPWRSAAALCWEAGFEFTPEIEGAPLVRQAWERGLSTIATSSAGRLFDAAAALVAGLDFASYEGQGPMMLEAMAGPVENAVRLPVGPDGEGVTRIDWAPLLPVLMDKKSPAAGRASIFHESLAQAIIDEIDSLMRREQVEAVGLTGGVFQNRRLAERVAYLLDSRGIIAKLPRRLPTNDGGLAFGQIVEAAASGAFG